MVILFLLFFRDHILPRGISKLSRVQFRMEEIVRFAEGSAQRMLPKMSFTGACVPTFSSIYNCCPPRDFCVVEKRTLLLRLSERPGRPRFVNNSLINEFLIVLEWACFQESSWRALMSCMSSEMIRRRDIHARQMNIVENTLWISRFCTDRAVHFASRRSASSQVALDEGWFDIEREIARVEPGLSYY